MGTEPASSACRPPREVEESLRSDALAIIGCRQTSGAQGAVALTVREGDVVLEAKWRPASSASAWNDPVAELAAHHVQRLVLEPADYVVPPAASHCYDAEQEARWLASAAPVEDMGCVLGYLSYWLTGSVTLVEARRDGIVPAPHGVWSADPALYDAARFVGQSRAERRNLAHLNVVAFLVRNGDAHAAQFVVYREPLHLFLVDNSVAFSAERRPAMRDRQDFSELVVPAIPADTAERVSRLGWEEVSALMRIEEYERQHGRWRRVPPGPLLEGGREHVRRVGDRVQVGLSEADARGVMQRVRVLQRAIESGAIGRADF
ncbi:MAG: hypothetical protein M3Y87_17475 [Myxococcota bacterium]|nr:hypothetical protein [Myxococcota bacterium]